MPLLFANRREAGRRLAEMLLPYAGQPDLIVLGLPRGGIPVAYEVATLLRAPLDAFMVRKLGAPGQPELAMGAIAVGGVVVLNPNTVRELDIGEEMIDEAARREGEELVRREHEFRRGRPPVDVRARTVILVDDGLATGATMFAAVTALRRMDPAKLLVAVPVGAPDTCDELAAQVDELVCALTPDPFRGVGMWYQDFTQTTDLEVRELLERAWSREAGPVIPIAVLIPAGDTTLAADLALPHNPKGLVLFAHGSGSSRHSPRNRGVAASLQHLGLATLLMDLFTPDEEEIDQRTRALRFDVALLARRLVAAVDWLQAQPATRSLNLGLFGASTGAGAALVAAAQRPALVSAVVARGGRPDLAGEALARVRCPTLLIVGGRDEQVIELNRDAMAHLNAACRLAIVPRATHLFEEEGALEEVARLAGEWYIETLAGPAHHADPVASPVDADRGMS